MHEAAVRRSFPRPLRPKERELLSSVLPADRPGYRSYRHLVEKLMVIGEGRMGEGNLILGVHGDTPTIAGPIRPVIAYGVVETTRERFMVTVREEAERQLDVEIVSDSGSEIPDHFEEKRRWTYSTWGPGLPSPSTGKPIREVNISGSIVLAIDRDEHRLWVHDGETGVNHLLPITNYYNELMLRKQIREPQVALRSMLLFEQLDSYSDGDLRGAFLAYNRMWRRVHVAPATDSARPSGLAGFFKRLLPGGRHHE
jgi:hypothetical protein